MFEKRFAEILVKERLVPPQSGVLLAVSGGPDSSALAVLTARYARLLKIKKLLMVYFDHGVRPHNEISSDIDAVRRLARLTGFPFKTVSLNIPARGPSFENKAREARYKALETMAAEGGYNIVMTGHTADDNAETLIIRMARGTGLKGLGGILPSRPFGAASRLVRPLVFFRKKEILAFLSRARFRFSVDSTNNDERYARNAVRRSIMPALESINPRAVKNLSNLSALLAEDSDCLEALSEAVCGRVVSGRFLDLKKFFRYNVSVRKRVLRRWLGGANDSALVAAVDGFLAASKKSARFVGGGVVLSIKGNLALNETLGKSSRRHRTLAH